MRLEKMEGLLQRVRPLKCTYSIFNFHNSIPEQTWLCGPQLCPDADFSKELGMTIDKSKWFPDPSGSGSSSIMPAHNSVASPSSMTDPGGVTSPSSVINDDGLESSDDEYGGHSVLLTESMKNMHLHPMLQKRFLGKSSGVKLVRAAIDLKSEYSGKDMDLHESVGTKRPEFWTLLPVSV